MKVVQPNLRFSGFFRIQLDGATKNNPKLKPDDLKQQLYDYLEGTHQLVRGLNANNEFVGEYRDKERDEFIIATGSGFQEIDPPLIAGIYNQLLAWGANPADGHYLVSTSTDDNIGTVKDNLDGSFTITGTEGVGLPVKKYDVFLSEFEQQRPN